MRPHLPTVVALAPPAWEPRSGLPGISREELDKIRVKY
jgi:hypothetical protein